MGGGGGGWEGGLQAQLLGVNGESALALWAQARLAHAMLHAVLLLARDVHDVERQQLAGDARERDVEMDLHALASALVDNQLRVYHDPAVVGPFSPGEEEHHDERDDGDDAARRRPDPRILDSLGESVKLCEPRFPGHGDVGCRWRDCVEVLVVPFKQGEAVDGQCLRLLGNSTELGGRKRGEPKESPGNGANGGGEVDDAVAGFSSVSVAGIKVEAT